MVAQSLVKARIVTTSITGRGEIARLYFGVGSVRSGVDFGSVGAVNQSRVVFDT